MGLSKKKLLFSLLYDALLLKGQLCITNPIEVNLFLNQRDLASLHRRQSLKGAIYAEKRHDFKDAFLAMSRVGMSTVIELRRDFGEVIEHNMVCGSLGLVDLRALILLYTKIFTKSLFKCPPYLHNHISC